MIHMRDSLKHLRKEFMLQMKDSPEMVRHLAGSESSDSPSKVMEAIVVSTERQKYERDRAKIRSGL